MVPLIKEALVDKKKWLKDEEFVDALAVAQSAPGALAINTSIIAGHKIGGKLGAVAGAMGAVLPSFLMILTLATFMSSVRNSKFFISFFNGIKPVTVALIFISTIKMAKSAKSYIKNDSSSYNGRIACGIYASFSYCCHCSYYDNRKYIF